MKETGLQNGKPLKRKTKLPTEKKPVSKDLEEKNKGGRPIKYVPEMAEKALEKAKLGWSIVEIAHELGISRSTFYEWKDTIQGFAEVHNLCKEFAEAFYYRYARNNLENYKVNTQLFNRITSVQFGWSEKNTVVHEGGDKPIKITLEVNLVRPKDAALEN